MNYGVHIVMGRSLFGSYTTLVCALVRLLRFLKNNITSIHKNLYNLAILNIFYNNFVRMSTYNRSEDLIFDVKCLKTIRIHGDIIAILKI